MTQTELGEKIGVQKSAVSKWERGETQNIKRSVLKKLSQYLDIPPVELIEENTNNTDDESITQKTEPPKGYRIVSEDELDDIWEKIYEMCVILNIDRKKKLMEYALELLKEQREEIDQMIELAKTFKK